MKKYLASVGNAQLLGKKDDQLVHIADIRTLTESTLSFSNTMEEIRAGEGAKLYGRFGHSAGLQVTLTDAMFDLNYVALQVGAEIEGNATAFFPDDLATVSSNTVTITKTPAALGNACGLDHIVVWAREKGCKAGDEWYAFELTAEEATNKQFSIADSELADKTSLCVRYFIEKPEARQIAISGNFIPAECILLLTTKLFAGDANAPETGKAVGSITVKIPRFQLDGQFDLSMAMSSAATLSLNGTALAVEDGSCDGNGIYAEIVEVEEGSSITTGLKMIAIDNESVANGETIAVYGIYGDGHTSKLDNTALTLSATGSGNSITTAGVITIAADGSVTATLGTFTDTYSFTAE